MEDREYYDNLQIMVDKAKDLKIKIDSTLDDEAKGYLKLALETLYADMRELIKERDQR
jgi:hypothetical protein|tara:strand:- start:1858 stop:2031 length:174 start_codon:yes stop_codon:yes gene_type:complete